jgi:hypothetical protein
MRFLLTLYDPGMDVPKNQPNFGVALVREQGLERRELKLEVVPLFTSGPAGKFFLNEAGNTLTRNNIVSMLSSLARELNVDVTMSPKRRSVWRRGLRALKNCVPSRTRTPEILVQPKFKRLVAPTSVAR